MWLKPFLIRRLEKPVDLFRTKIENSLSDLSELIITFNTEEEALRLDPQTRLERQNARLLKEKMRLDRENDYLANEYASCKVNLKQKIDQVRQF